MASKHRYSNRSMRNLQGAHPDLYAVALLALKLSHVDFAIICGERSLSQQYRLVDSGKSKTTNSRHLMRCPGEKGTRWGLSFHAVDVAAVDSDGKLDYAGKNIELLKEVVSSFHAAADLLGIDGVESGGELWGWDWFHIQLSWKTHPIRP